jgi:hypothetical protein
MALKNHDDDNLIMYLIDLYVSGMRCDSGPMVKNEKSLMGMVAWSLKNLLKSS